MPTHKISVEEEEEGEYLRIKRSESFQFSAKKVPKVQLLYHRTWSLRDRDGGTGHEPLHLCYPGRL